MKIGLSYSRCIRDIVDGKVDLTDVLVVIARTDFDPHNDEQWEGIWAGYHGYSPWSNPEWASYEDADEEKFRKISIELYDTGRLHQPRQFGAHPTRMPYYWLEASLPAEELESNPAVQRAWQQFQIVAGLAKSEKILKDDF
jgi:hypothetical protein